LRDSNEGDYPRANSSSRMKKGPGSFLSVAIGRAPSDSHACNLMLLSDFRVARSISPARLHGEREATRWCASARFTYVKAKEKKYSISTTHTTRTGRHCTSNVRYITNGANLSRINSPLSLSLSRARARARGSCLLEKFK